MNGDDSGRGAPPAGGGPFTSVELLRALATPPPDLAAEDAERIAEREFGLRGRATALGGERDANFLVRGAGREGLLKIIHPAEADVQLDFRVSVLDHLAAGDPQLPAPRVIPALGGRRWIRCEDAAGGERRACMLSCLPGAGVDHAPGDARLMRGAGAFAARVDRALRGFFHPAADYPLAWDLKRAGALAGLCTRLPEGERRDFAERCFERFDRHVAPALAGLRAQVIHNDLSYHNMTVDPEAPWRIAGVFDFGDCLHAPLVQEIATPVAELPFDRPDPLSRGAEIVAGYHALTPWEPGELALIPHLAAMRLALSMLIAAWRPLPAPRPGFEDLDAQTWRMCRAFAAGFEGLEGLYRAACGMRRAAAAGATPSREALLARRRAHLVPGLALSYEEPLHLVRGEGVWLYDADGRAYLDAYNNVPQVGHCHPRVVDAIARQAATLNTNTRYLYEALVDYAERLVATMPVELDTCILVSSGSEANDLAWRIARACTGHGGALVMERAYHGFTDATHALSPDAFDDPARLPGYVATLGPPDDYRGPWDRSRADRGARYAALAGRAVESLSARGHAPAAFFVDTMFSSNGIIDPAPGYLEGVRECVHAAGGLFVADEVQAGFGRSGSHMWGFERGGVLPDLVTLGKPIGNGHPIGAVVLRRDLARRFAAQEAFFSTTGGNPVSCAAALAVLEVIAEEGLQENARRVGAELKAGIEDLARRHPLIGDVRGAGLFIGVELVRDRERREPAGPETRRVLNALRRDGVLVGVEGQYGNVLKIRPPIVFRSPHAARLIAALDRALEAAA